MALGWVGGTESGGFATAQLSCCSYASESLSFSFNDKTAGDLLRRLASHLPVFEAPGFAFGSWEPSRKREDGVVVLGWFVPGPEADAFLADLGGWITPLDWMTWASSSAGQAFLGHPDAVASASA